ncbi:MAG TPA: polysaccharide biosynthesis/export family protein [Tepidisphaeraceae bacterium]|jgi:polysaccharide export outer membrane protein|nr:polysaccharide biosynthesis/export family protein [Tepidisphaeraceae bacterium]
MVRLIVLSLLALALAGCALQSTPNAEGPRGVFRNAGLHEVSEREYRVDPPDEIVIHAVDIKELDGQHQIVRPDGKVSLDLVGEVLAAGKTPSEIAADITHLASKYYKNPEIRLDVVANSKFYYVFGFGTGGQGKHPYLGRVTVVTALATAGYTPDGWPEQIRISRPGRNGEPNATVVVNFSKVAEHGDLSQNYLLEEGDIIYVPYNPLSEWNFALQRLLGPLTGSASLVTTPVGIVSAAKSGI